LVTTKRIFVSFSLVSVWLLTSCSGSKKSENALTEGVIEYNAEVVDQAHPMAGLAPGSATVKFKENKSFGRNEYHGYF
jgi:major membrane immunogen (membrane-anchored lipoprotein)